MIDNSLTFQGLCKSVKYGNNSKEILSNISGVVNGGETCALMGCSGSGKTTLLQLLGGRAMKNTKGRVLLGSHQYQKKTMKRKVAYVLQDDILMPSEFLTVRDHLQFSASMRLSRHLTPAEREERVLKTIQDLGLSYCADTPLDLVSGGERKRTSIGIEIVSDPALLLLDEATSGLDSSSANSLSWIIRSIATSLQIPVVQSIHQPSTGMFYSFDKILLLSEGRMVYFGKPINLMGYLSNLGYTPEEIYVNPADFALSLLNPFAIQSAKDILVDKWNKEEKLTESMEIFDSKGGKLREIEDSDLLEMKENYVFKETEIEETEFSDNLLEENVDSSKNRDVRSYSFVTASTHQEHAVGYPSSYRTQFFALLKRAFKTAKSSRLGFINTAETIILALMIGACWFQRPSDEAHFGDITSFLFLSIVYWFFVSLFNGLIEFLPERKCLKKERESGMYRVSAYFLAKTLSTIPLRVLLPSLYVFIAYPMAIKDASLSSVLAIAAILVLVTLVAESIGFLIGTLTIEYDKAMSIGTLLAVGMMIFGGFYVDIADIPAFLRWLRYTSAFLYSFDAFLQIYVLLGKQIQCQGGSAIHACHALGQSHGLLSRKDMIAWLHLDEISIERNIGILICMIIGFRFLAYLALRFVPSNTMKD